MIKYMEEITSITHWYSAIQAINNDAKKYLSVFDEIAYQYTKLHVVDEILKTGNVLATSMKFLNDTEEYSYAYRQLNYDNYKESDHEFFSISFTTKKDDIPQYMIYAGEIGVCMEYDFSFEKWGEYKDPLKHWTIGYEKPVLACKDNLDKISSFNICKPIKIGYISNNNVGRAIREYRKALNKVAYENMKDEEINDLMKFLPCFIKNSDFASEKEVRFAVAASDVQRVNIEENYTFKYRGEDFSHTNIDFIQSGNKLLKPCIKLFYIDGENNNIGWPLKSIWIGPGRDQERAFQSIKLRLKVGEVKLFPLPLTELILRLVNYYLYLLEFMKKKIFNDSIKQININFLDTYELFDDQDNLLKVTDKMEQTIRKATKIRLNNVEFSLVEGKHLRCIGLDSKVSFDAKKIIVAFRDNFKKKLEEFLFKYKLEKDIKNMLETKFNKVKFKEDYILKSSEILMNELEKYNYFSFLGISVHRSIKNLAQY